MVDSEPKDPQNTAEDRNFQNLQRIMSNGATARLTILGLMFSLNPLGGAGLYTLVHNAGGKGWITGLCVTMLLVSIALTLIHYRERSLFDATLNKLKGMKVEFPEESSYWQRFNWTVIQLLYIGTIAWWIVAFILFGFVFTPS